MTEESDDLRSNYSSDRDSMSIYGTEGARSNASSPTSKTSLGYTTAPKEDGETLKKGSSLEAAINHMEAHYSSNDLASSIPIDSHVDVMKIGGSPKNRTKTRPAPLVLPPSEKKKKVPKKNSDSGLHELSKEAKEALYPPEGHHALEMDLVNSSSGMNASTGSGKPQEGNSQRKLSQSASANSATKFGRSVSNNYSSNAFGHRHLSYGQGGSGAIGQVNGVCDVDIILAPACLGYTLVRFRRIHGKTSDFHEAVSFVTNLLELERQQAIEDIMPRGESELM
ncbi:hypothetical protein AGDE_13356 [Angomonas deanei]|nr:hypothetical protein AGDE_13356 [Angomonas deanei]|eukprot:EPY22397.1 hypothetical protein AGDE_13356 [Angomonas deanei]